MTAGERGSGPPADGEFQVHLPQDVESLEGFKKGLQLGALDIVKDCPFPLRSRLRVVIHTPRGVVTDLLAEVAYASPGRVGMQILDLPPEELEVLLQVVDSLGTMPTPPPAEKKAAPPPPPAEESEEPPPPKKTAPAAPAARRVSLAPEGKLSFHFPPFLKRMHEEARDEGWEGRTALLAGTVPGVIQQLSRERAVGRLTVEEDAHKTRTRVYFNDGQVVGVEQTPKPETDTVAYLMRRKQRIQEADYREIREAREKTGETDGKLLRKKVGPHGLALIMRQVMYKTLGTCFALTEARYKYEGRPELLDEVFPVPISLRRAFFRGLLEAAAMCRTEELQLGLAEFMTHFVVLREKLPFDLAQLNLNSSEQRFFDVTLAKPVLLRKLFNISALSKMQSLRIVYTLYFIGFVDFTTKYQPPADEFLPEIKQALEEMNSMTEFEILHSHWAALQEDVKKGYERALAEWKSMEIPPEARQEGSKLVQDIIARVEKAYAALSDDDRRRAYRDQIIEPNQRLFSAELLATHARTEIFRNDRKWARHHILQAIDLDPRNTEYRQILRDCGSGN